MLQLLRRLRWLLLRLLFMHTGLEVALRLLGRSCMRKGVVPLRWPCRLLLLRRSCLSVA